MTRYTRFIHPIGRAGSRREALAIAIAVGSMGTLGFSITAPLLPDLADAFGVSRGAIGMVQAAISVPGVLLSALIGYLADRLGRRRVVLASLLIFSTFGVAGFFARSFGGLITVRFLQGIGTSGILGVGIVLVADQFTGNDRVRAMGYNITGMTTVSMLGPAISGLLATRNTFLPFLFFSIGYPLALWATRLPPDAPQTATEPPLRHMGDAVAVMKREATWINYLGVLLASVGAAVVLHGLSLTTAPIFMEEEFGTPVGIRGLIVATFQVGVILTAIRIGRIRSRFGSARMITSSFSLMSAGTAIVVFASGAAVVALGLAVAGVGFGLWVPLAQEYTARAGSTLYRGVTILTWVTVVRISQVFGPPAGSFLSDTAGGRVTFGVAAIGMALMATVWRPLQARINQRFGR
ncbi:MAG: MFS transporter [Acidimicrobiia bacterium]